MTISREAKRKYDRKRYRANAEAIRHINRLFSRRFWASMTPAERSARRRKYEYGLEPEEFDSLLRRQRGRCAICRAPKPTDLDHCHRTNRIRGVLCRRCNVALGGFRDHIPTLKRAILYLKKHK